MGAGGEEKRKSERPGLAASPPLPPASPGALVTQLTVVQQVADHLLAAGTDCVVQERATPTVPVHEVTPGSVQLLQLREGDRAGLGLFWATLFPATEMSPNSHRPQA